MGGCNFRNILPINVPKHNGGMFRVFRRETFKIYVNLQSRTWAKHFHHRHCGSHEYAYSREEQSQRNLHNSQGFSQTAISCNYPCQGYLWSCILQHRPFWEQCGKRIWGTDDRESTSRTTICQQHCSYPLAVDLQ